MLESTRVGDHQADGPSEQRDPSGRRLRNRIILPNAVAWSLIIAVILWASHAVPPLARLVLARLASTAGLIDN